jgi:hypothetical protein
MEELIDEPTARMRLSTRVQFPSAGIGNEVSLSIDPLNPDVLDVQTSRLSELLRSDEIKGYREQAVSLLRTSLLYLHANLPGCPSSVCFSHRSSSASSDRISVTHGCMLRQ